MNAHSEHVIPTTPKRPALARLVGRIVVAEGVLCRPYRDRNGKRLRLIQQVYVYPHLSFDYLWVDVPPYVLKQVRDGTRFTFRGLVEEYTRTDGSKDFGLNWRALVKG